MTIYDIINGIQLSKVHSNKGWYIRGSYTSPKNNKYEERFMINDIKEYNQLTEEERIEYHDFVRRFCAESIIKQITNKRIK